jgi:hypothetical protein
MKRSKTPISGRRFVRFVADALAGRRGVTAMVAGYSACAVVLLAYVSTKVYTYSLMEDISACERKRQVLKERVGLLTERYAELSAMDRVTEICEGKLGMVPADAGGLLRVSIDPHWSPKGLEGGLDGEGLGFPETMDRGIDEITEVIRR